MLTQCLLYQISLIGIGYLINENLWSQINLKEKMTAVLGQICEFWLNFIEVSPYGAN